MPTPETPVTNKTSEAFDLLIEGDVSLEDVPEILGGVHERYQRMEEAMKKAVFYIDGAAPDWSPEALDTLKEALAFDPLSE